MSLVFTRFLNLFNDRIPNLAVDCAGTFWGTLPGRVIAVFNRFTLKKITALSGLPLPLAVPKPKKGILL